MLSNGDLEKELCGKYCINIKYSSLEDLCEKRNIEIIRDAALSEYTTFEIGGKCDFLVKPDSVGSLRDVLVYCRENNIKYYILGRGSNVLVSDNGLKGVVIVISSDFFYVLIFYDCAFKPSGPYFMTVTKGSSLVRMG